MNEANVASYEAYASRLRGIARRIDARFLYARHTEIELRKDGISKPEVENMLRRCRVSLVEMSGGEETLRAEGTDIDGRPITAVVVLYDDVVAIKVITGGAWK